MKIDLKFNPMCFSIMLYFSMTMLGGCFSESVYINKLRIKNSLDFSISYCLYYELPKCNNDILPGGEVMIPYISRKKSGIDDYSAYNNVRINMCGNIFSLDKLGPKFSILKIKGGDHVAVINKMVYASVCEKHEMGSRAG